MRVALVAGPGGSGVTTVAALTAVAAAARGARTVLISPGPSAGQILGMDPREGLTLLRPDPVADAAAARPLLTKLLHALSADDVVEPAEVAGLPGADQLSTLLAVAAVAAAGDCQALVIDAGCGPVELLTAADSVGRLIDIALPAPLRILQQVGGIFGSRGNDAADTAAAVGRLLDRLLLARAVLTESTGAALHLVTGSRPLRWTAAATMVPVLAIAGLGLGRVIRNASDQAGDDEPDWPSQTLTVQEQPEEPRSDRLDALARTVFGDRDPLEVTPGPALRDPQVVRTDGGFQIDLPVPLAAREDLDLARSGDDLLVSVHGRTRRVELPSVLRRCRVAGAAFADGALTVTFVADPAQWPEALHPDGDSPSAAAASVAADARG